MGFLLAAAILTLFVLIFIAVFLFAPRDGTGFDDDRMTREGFERLREIDSLGTQPPRPWKTKPLEGCDCGRCRSLKGQSPRESEGKHPPKLARRHLAWKSERPDSASGQAGATPHESDSYLRFPPRP